VWRPLVVGGVLACVSGGLASSAIAPEKYVSWADRGHRYGWTVVERGPPTFVGEPDLDPFCKGATGGWMYVCSTEDGGRTWHRVFQAGNGLMYLLGYTRTSRTAGVASIGREDMPRTLRNGVFWTIDNGRHWFETTQIGRNVEGRGRNLYWTDRFSHRLYQVRPWPPRRNPRCRGFFSSHPQDQRPRRGGAVCVGARANAGMRSELIARLGPDEGSFWVMRATPRGVVALIAPVLPLRVLTREEEENRTYILASPPVPSGSYLADARIEGEWPSFSLHGAFRSGERFVWRSQDGGHSWSVAERS
jgi:hypothetical protein